MSALIVTRERTTASRSGPSKRQPPTHRPHQASVSRTAASGSSRRGARRWEGYQASVSARRSPAATSKSATVVRPSPRSGRSVVSARASGPATAWIPSADRRTQGTTEP